MRTLCSKIIALLILFFAISIYAAENSGTFKILILGTRHFADVNLVTKNIRSTRSVKRYVPSVSNQKHLEFVGVIDGDKDTFIEDIKSLSLDRFDVSVKDSQNKGLVVTLRKKQ